jgi:hypothetical protein
MVTATIDPIRVPTITQSAGEIAEMQGMIEAGQLPKDFIKRHIDAVDANVYGHDAPKDRKGFRLEQGLGSPKNQTRNSIDAYKKYGKDEPGFDENVKRMEAELKACDEAKDAADSPSFHYGRK